MNMRIGQKSIVVLMVFSALVGAGGVVLLASSHAADLSLGPVSVSVGKQPVSTSPTTTASKVGDINGDGKVDNYDVSKFLSDYKSKATSDDLDKNGVVDTKDLDLLLANYNK